MNGHCEPSDRNGARRQGWTVGEDKYPAEMAHAQGSPLRWGKGSHFGNKGKGMNALWDWTGPGMTKGRGKGKTQFYRHCYLCGNFGHSQTRHGLYIASHPRAVPQAYRGGNTQGVENKPQHRTVPTGQTGAGTSVILESCGRGGGSGKPGRQENGESERKNTALSTLGRQRGSTFGGSQVRATGFDVAPPTSTQSGGGGRRRRARHRRPRRRPRHAAGQATMNTGTEVDAKETGAKTELEWADMPSRTLWTCGL